MPVAAQLRVSGPPPVYIGSVGEKRTPAPLWPVLALALGAVAVSVLSHYFLFPAFSWNRDEPVYLWQMAGLREGLLSSPTGGFPASFHPWLAGVRNGSFFSQYTLGWPLVLLGADLVVGSPAGALALGAALSVVGTYLLARELTHQPRVAMTAAILMLVSPMVVIQSGIYLGYLFTLGLGLLVATAVVSGFRTGKRGRMVVAGLLVGWIFMTRPFDAVLWGVAIVGTMAWAYRRDPKRILAMMFPIGCGFAPLVIATLLYNQHITGSFSNFPITAVDPLDTFGFGQRRIMPTFAPATYTPLQGLRSSAKQGLLLPIFMTGGYILAVLAGVRLWRDRRETSTRVLLAIGAAFPIGYLAFWGMYVSSPTMPLSGPIYYTPLFAVIAIAGTAELLRWWDTRRTVAVWLIVVMAVITIPVGANRIDVNRRISESQLPWKRSSESVPPDSLVFTWRGGDYLMFFNPFSANRPNLDGPVLYATDQGSENFRLLDAYPERTPYVQRTTLPPDGEIPNDHPKTPRVTLTRVRVVRAPGLVLATGVHDEKAPRGARFYARMSGQVVRSWPSKSGDETPELAVRAGAVPTELDGSIAEYGLAGSGTISIGLGRGTTALAAARHPIVRQDFHYRVRSGHIELLTPFTSFRRGRYGKSLRWFAVGPGVPWPVSLDTVVVPQRKE